MVLTKRITVSENEIHAARTSGTSRQSTVECEQLFIVKTMVITKRTVPSERLLGLGSKLYPSNLQRMLNKDLTRFSIHAESFSGTLKSSN